MIEDGKNSESLKLNLNSSANLKHKNLKDYLKADMSDRRGGSDNTMRIYIKRKSTKKIINMNLSEQSCDNEKIQIKIEKEKMKRSFVRESNSPKKTESRMNTELVLDLTSVVNLRKDAHGNMIEKGNPKKYKLTFLDLNQKSKNLENFDQTKRKENKFIDCVKVECYKSFNNYDDEKDVEHEKTTCKCGCLIF